MTLEGGSGESCFERKGGLIQAGLREAGAFYLPEQEKATLIELRGE